MKNDLLVKMYPMLRVRNLRDVATQVSYMTGDSVQIPPNATVRISSNGLGQLPPADQIEFVSPTLVELHEAGIIQLGRAAEPAADAPAAPVEEATDGVAVSPRSTVTRKKPTAR